jgi:hypothetical protein
MGGEDHGTIRVSVLEQMADAHLARVDDFTMQGTACYTPLSFLYCSAFRAVLSTSMF